MKLYYTPGACSLAVHIALREAGVSVDLVQVDLASHRTAAGDDFYAINPRGYVPLLELEDGSRRTEVAALLQSIGEGAPASGLVPAPGEPERFEVQKWIAFVASELHKVFSPWLWHKETDDGTRKACKEKIATRLAELDVLLGTREFLAGSRFSAADAYGFAIVGWAPLLGMQLTPYPRLAAWLARVAQRPAVHAALLAEGLAKA